MDIMQSIAKAEHATIVVKEMLEAVAHLCFENTANGVEERNANQSREENCFWWVNDKYDCVSSVTRAAVLIAESTAELLSDVWDEVRRKGGHSQ